MGLVRKGPTSYNTKTQLYVILVLNSLVYVWWNELALVQQCYEKSKTDGNGLKVTSKPPQETPHFFKLPWEDVSKPPYNLNSQCCSNRSWIGLSQMANVRDLEAVESGSQKPSPALHLNLHLGHMQLGCSKYQVQKREGL